MLPNTPVAQWYEHRPRNAPNRSEMSSYRSNETESEVKMAKEGVIL